MKKEIIEILDFEDNDKPKVGRPKLADKNTKKKSLIVAGLSFVAITFLLIFGYGTLFGFKNLNLKATANMNNNEGANILIEEIKPLIKNITLKEGTARKVYLTVIPSSATNKEIEYSSSDEDVATVDIDGKVTAISEGNAVIKAITKDGSDKDAEFNITVIKNAEGKCKFTELNKTSDGIDYEVECNNAKIKEIDYKVNNDPYSKLLTKKTSDSIPFSKEQMKKKITFKVVYYANNSSVTKYSTKMIDGSIKDKSKNTGSCDLNITSVNSNSARYDVTCDNATVNNIAYKIGNGSYVGLDSSSLADTVIFEESDVTRTIYFKIDYKIDGTNELNTITRNSIIEKVINKTEAE